MIITYRFCFRIWAAENWPSTGRDRSLLERLPRLENTDEGEAEVSDECWLLRRPRPASAEAERQWAEINLTERKSWPNSVKKTPSTDWRRCAKNISARTTRSQWIQRTNCRGSCNGSRPNTGSPGNSEKHKVTRQIDPSPEKHEHSDETEVVGEPATQNECKGRMEKTFEETANFVSTTSQEDSIGLPSPTNY